MTPKETQKEIQLEVIKFLKGKEYQKVLKGYKNKFDTLHKYFESKYESENLDYNSNEATVSEKRMMIEKLNLFKGFLSDITGDGVAQDTMRELIGQQISAIKSQLYNTVTNSFGMSKDTPMHTEDDLLLWRKLHYNDFHLSIIGMMNPPQDDYETVNKNEIYDNPEEYLEV